MSPRPIQDIIVNKKRTASYAPKKDLRARADWKGVRRRRPPRGRNRKGGRGFNRTALWTIAGATVFILIIALSTLFESATVKVFPKQKTLALTGAFEASREREEGASPISFEVMTINEHLEKEVPATGAEHVDHRAFGTIVVFNDYSESSQRLIKNTRFETSDGLMFRIRDSIEVPGRRVVAGKTVPGSVETTVYADQPGDAYNIGLTDFAIPGFNGTPRFDGFYARSKTEMKGGFSGLVQVAPEEDVRAARAELKDRISEKLLAAAHSQKPNGFILYDDAVFIRFNDEEAITPGRNTEQENVVVKESGTLYGVLFNEKELSELVAQTLIPTLPGEEGVFIHNLHELSFSIIEDKKSFEPAEDTRLSFSLSGEPTITWLFDGNKLAKDLTNRPKGDVQAILNEFPSIIRAEVTVRPFWRRSFPDNFTDIHIQNNTE